MKIPRPELMAFIYDYDFSMEGFARNLEKSFNHPVVLCSDLGAVYKWTARNQQFEKKFRLTKKEGRGHLVSRWMRVLDIFLICFPLTIYFLCRMRPKYLIVNTYVLPILCWPVSKILKTKLIYVCADWFFLERKQSLRDLILNKYIFTNLDWICCKVSFLVLNYSPAIRAAREKYWGRSPNHRQETYPLFIEAKIDYHESVRHNIVFFGNLRADSGLEVLLENVSRLRERIPPLRIVIVGEINEISKNLSTRYKSLLDADILEFKGYIHRAEFAAVLANSFCGINLINQEFNYSQYTVPGKLIDYLQHYVPVLITRNVGSFADVIEEMKLGSITTTDGEDMFEKVLHQFRHQQQYRSHIRRFITNYSTANLRKWINP